MMCLFIWPAVSCIVSLFVVCVSILPIPLSLLWGYLMCAGHVHALGEWKSLRQPDGGRVSDRPWRL